MFDTKRIVVVDDDAEMNKAIARILRVARFDPVTFTSSEGLLASDAAESAACLILDVHLPGLTGLELQTRLREQGVAAPVILVTGYDNRETRARAQEVGTIAVLVKPFAGSVLLTAVRRAVARCDGSELSAPS